MAMGHRAAINIQKQIFADIQGIPAHFEPWPATPPMIALAIGKKAMVYDPAGGVRCSEEQMKVFFGDDLAFKQLYSHLKLSEGW